MPQLDGSQEFHTTRRFRALDHDFAVRTTDADMSRYLDRVLGSLAVPDEPAQLYHVAGLRDGAPYRYALSWAGQPIEATNSPAQVVATLLWHVNRQAVEQSGRYLLLHAAAAEWQGNALLLAGPMESGKTTLVAGLVQAGWRYLTDEVAAIHPVSRLVMPYPKALTVDQGSWGVLADLKPVNDPASKPYIGPQWHVDPRSIRPDAIAVPAPAGLVVFPTYEAGATTEVIPLRAAEALVGLCENSFNLARHGVAGLETLRAVVARSARYRLRIGELEAACKLVLDLLDSPRARPQEMPVS